MLTLYRRHSLVNCTKTYPQNLRVFFPSTKTDRAKDCSCTICAEGTLSIVGLITNKSTGCATWPEATAVAAQWQGWGQTTKPPVNDGKVTVQYAVDAMLTLYEKNNEGSTVEGMTHLLQKRIVPFCADNSIKTIDALFDDLNTATRFVTSWVNMRHPTQPLAATSRKLALLQLRQFGNFCLDRTWCKKNEAKSKSLTIKTKTAKKFGTTPDEDARFLAALKVHHLRRHRFGVASEQLESDRLVAFYWAMRGGGLRISDATKFNDTELVRRADGKGWAFDVSEQTKTGEPVYVPVTDEVAEALLKLPFMGQKGGKRYWFWDAEKDIEQTIGCWYKAFKSVVKRVAKEKPFINTVSPHVCRHTFAITNLNNGVGIKTLSRWLGHSTVAMTDEHYSHAITGDKLVSEREFDETVSRQLARAA
jgi:integrase